MLNGFRAFGGIANNVEQRQGGLGYGLFPIEQSHPIQLFVPEHLLVRTDNLKLVNGVIKIVNETEHPTGYSSWYSEFQANYSWGKEGRSSIEQFEQELSALPSALLDGLHSLGISGISERQGTAPWDEFIFKRFLQTRAISYKGDKVLMPIIELINHSSLASSFECSNGIGVTGSYEDEILVNYNNLNPLHRFFCYGFSCLEPVTTSLAFEFEYNSEIVIRVRRRLKEINKSSSPINPMAGSYTVPKVSRHGNVIEIENPVIGIRNHPRLPRTLIVKALNEHPGIDGSEVFDRMVAINVSILMRLLRIADGCSGDFAHSLRQALFNQLDGSTQHNYGIRRDLL